MAGRAGRSFARDPFFSPWVQGPLLLLCGVLALLADHGAAPWIAVGSVVAFSAWIVAVWRWSRRWHNRNGSQRRGDA